MKSQINIEIVFALPSEQQLKGFSVLQGTSARQALIKALDSGLIMLADYDVASGVLKLPIGVFGEVVDDDYVLQEGDRLEIYRPLLQDPKDRRRSIAQATKLS